MVGGHAAYQVVAKDVEQKARWLSVHALTGSALDVAQAREEALSLRALPFEEAYQSAAQTHPRNWVQASEEEAESDGGDKPESDGGDSEDIVDADAKQAEEDAKAAAEQTLEDASKARVIAEQAQLMLEAYLASDESPAALAAKRRTDSTHC